MVRKNFIFGASLIGSTVGSRDFLAEWYLRSFVVEFATSGVGGAGGAEQDLRICNRIWKRKHCDSQKDGEGAWKFEANMIEVVVCGISVIIAKTLWQKHCLQNQTQECFS